MQHVTIDYELQKSCDHEYPIALGRVIAENGKSLVAECCEQCWFEKYPGQWVAHARIDVDVQSIPVIRDHRNDAARCARCERSGVEQHHYAPRELFEQLPRVRKHPVDPSKQDTGLCYDYGTVSLCPGCHQHWHEVFRNHRLASVQTCPMGKSDAVDGICVCCRLERSCTPHFIAPPEIFGTRDAIQYGTSLLCERCHKALHDVLWRWLDEAA